MKITLELEVDPRFHNALVEGDLPTAYWGRTMASHATLGRLIRELDGADADTEAALRAWAHADATLPRGWHRLDNAAVGRAWAAGVRRWGERWFVEGDASRVDIAVQEALLGSVVYG